MLPAVVALLPRCLRHSADAISYDSLLTPKFQPQINRFISQITPPAHPFLMALIYKLVLRRVPNTLRIEGMR